MTSIPRVLHSTAKPITLAEFVDAVRATCPPRFPLTRAQHARPVGLALSGGVDSMALAVLCSKAKKYQPGFVVADHPVNSFQALIVDHGLREGSTEEATKVRDLVSEKLNFRGAVLQLNWEGRLAEGQTPKDIPNFETVARRLRFQRLGKACQFRKFVSLFLAHHEDDQYETVLMRLISGHGPSGLRGIRPFSDIPECYYQHGTYASGFVDDQTKEHPYYNTRPSPTEKKFLRQELAADVGPQLMREVEQGLKGDLYLHDEFDQDVKRSRWLPRLAPLDIEDGGVMVYRPLLEFGKDRLIATCEEAGVPWFEDATNHDPTLTMRNAVRHLYKNYQLPVALQKPAILQLRKRCDAKAKALDAEVDRLLARTIIRNFRTNVGTLLVQLPPFSVPRLRKGSIYNTSRRKKRHEHYRALAALLVRRLISFVTPEFQVTPAASLQQVVARLFPQLVGDEADSHLVGKAFNICGVHFLPVQTSSSGSLNWYLSRAPYQSNMPLPDFYQKQMRLRDRWIRRDLDRLKWPVRAPWVMFDGRFWMRVWVRIPVGIRLAPFMKEHAKPFREALADDGARDDLASLLKRYAPGKVRYTLPAIYGIGNIDWALYGESSNVEARTRAGNLKAQEQDIIKRIKEGEWDEQIGHDETLTLLALPTLGVHLPGLDQWLRWDIRYRRVDSETLARSASHEGHVVRRGQAWKPRVPSKYRKGSRTTSPVRRRPRTPPRCQMKP